MAQSERSCSFGRLKTLSGRGYRFMNRRVVITGCGIISSIGNSCAEVLEALEANRSGIVRVPEWAELGLKSCVGGTIKGIDLESRQQEIGLKSRYMDLSALYGVLSAMEAVADSGIDPEALASERVGCIVGGGTPSSDSIYEAGSKVHGNGGRLTPYGVTRAMSSTCSANLVNFYGIKGRSYSICSACATSLHNIGHGFELISNGICDTILSGGADEVSSLVTYMFDKMRNVLSTAFNDSPPRASRPYDRARDGFVISGGAGIVVLEELEKAKKRNAPIYGEIIGYGASSDGHDIVQPPPDGEGAVRCMKEALSMAHCSTDGIDYINTHGTSTPVGDVAEGRAIQQVFGNRKIPISSTKSLTGHGIGATGVQELIYCLLMMKHGFITASVNIEDLDPAFADLDIVRENRDATLNRILNNSFGFGGTNASMIIGKV